MKKYVLVWAVLIVFVTPRPLFAQHGQKLLTLDDVTKGYGFYPASVRGLRSMNDGKHFTILENGNMIVKSSYETGAAVDTLFNAAVVKGVHVENINEYEFSDDESKILFYTDREQIYRYSFKASYYVYDLLSGVVIPLSDNGKQQLVTFSPGSAKVAFMRENNLFIKDLLSGEETQITADGNKNEIINGAPDWVYEEEFSFSKAFAWSPDGSRLSYIRFDERRVKEFSMTIYKGLKPEIEGNALYPENRHWKYPKAGEDNSIVTVHAYDIPSGITTVLDIGEETDIYIPRIKWTNNPDIVCIYRLNRVQNKLELLFADVKTGLSNVVYKDENAYFIDESNFDYLTFLDDNQHFIMVNEQSGWNHIYLYSINGDRVQPITQGDYDVTGFYGVDEAAGLVYFQAAKGSPVQREVYVCQIDGSHIKKISSSNGINEADFSKGFRYFIHYWSNSVTPPYVSLHDATGKEIRMMEDNEKLKDNLKDYSFSLKEMFSFVTSEGIQLNGWMIRPVGFNPKTKYPVLMYQYGGPNSQEVQDEWSFGWYQHLAQQGYLIVCVDGRGTGCRGEAFRKSTYLQLGKYETIDQMETARYLGSLPYVDAGRIGIWGWSYGGFITLSCLTQEENLFKIGIAVAPVTNWKYYDNIYTERFMRKPQENPSGYEDNAPISRAGQLDGKLLIVHGTADDNVHVQNTLEFCEALVQANIQFDMMLYTKRNHGIYGGNTRYHLYKMMTEYIIDNL